MKILRKIDVTQIWLILAAYALIFGNMVNLVQTILFATCIISTQLSTIITILKQPK